MKWLVALSPITLCPSLWATDIGFGKVAAIKQYDLANNKSIKIYLNKDATKQNEQCLELGYIQASITHTQHDEAVINRMLSIAMSTYMSNKKIRLYSENNNCEVSLTTLQENYF